jgi:hypothetical protein
MILKLHIHLTDPDDKVRWEPLYIDVSGVYAWYLPTYDEEVGNAIVIFTPGDSFYVKQEPHLLKYLQENVYPKEVLVK